jgi:hypothetical protein
MTKQPLTNAIAALAYIVAVATFMFYATDHMPGPDTVLAPIALISLFTLSAGVMGYIFLSQPVQLYLDDHKKEAVNLFVQTLAIFGGLTVLVLAIFFATSWF